MKYLKNIIVWSVFSVLLASCSELDIAPVSITGEKDIFSSEPGVISYMSRMYSSLPIEDFKYRYNNPGLFHNANSFQQNACLTGEAINRDGPTNASGETGVYWAEAYKLIREANVFMETFPKYSSAFSQERIGHYMAEARFVRAFTYFALVKRYGGVPLLDVTLNYPSVSLEETQLPRESEEAVWDFISADLDAAAAGLPETADLGRANKYAALALKSRAMLYAGSIAKYNNITLDAHGKRVCGIPDGRANDYFKQAYDAAKQVESKYSLYKKEWQAGNKGAQYQNFVNLFYDVAQGSPENIFVKYYKYPESVHSYDCLNAPAQQMVGGGSAAENCPTLDLVELYDGLPKDGNGRLKTTDDNGYYRLFTNRMDFFANAEPRLRATVIFPGDVFRGEEIDIRRGIYIGTETSDIPKIIPDAYPNYYYVVNPKLQLSSSWNGGRILYNTKHRGQMYADGQSGTATDAWYGTWSGFLLRKYMNLVKDKATLSFSMSDQAWIEIRYAEVLLNRAEAAYELYAAGQSDIDYQNDAYLCINEIRERAGANLLNGKVALNSVDTVRKERKKELAFENKAFWDLRRWRTAAQEQNNTGWRILMPFYADEADKYFFDASETHPFGWRWNFNTLWYYNAIPASDMAKNPNLVNNPGY
ncbi:MAG: RagB/SusD family nutrient uptake outer membrane protein [Dysgonamonadaceae bacterium]|jgi:hypothetical protein|nr:RagB/SusD family nutrient uptake outer membrane protein [Dysgonamonadaceae bacterium]